MCHKEAKPKTIISVGHGFCAGAFKDLAWQASAVGCMEAAMADAQCKGDAFSFYGQGSGRRRCLCDTDAACAEPLKEKTQDTKCASGWHLAPKGATTCDYGTPAALGTCAAAVAEIAAALGKKPGRTMQRGKGGRCNDGGWGSVPLGCSAASGGDWTAHWKDRGVNCAANGHFRLVCSGAGLVSR